MIMKPMLLTASEELPSTKDWLYEVKYDGFRCIIHWDKTGIQIMSRNEKELTNFYPEIVTFSEKAKDKIYPFLPLTLDGEICYLINNYKSNFSVVQTRGRMRNEDVILNSANKFPCNLIVFDLIRYKGLDISDYVLNERKALLKSLFEAIGFSTTIDYVKKGQIQLIDLFQKDLIAIDTVKIHGGEGVVAKHQSSTWDSSVRTTQWLKVKNWFYVTVILTKYDQENGYFHGSIYREDQLIEITVFKHGFSEQEFQTLVTFFKRNGRQVTSETWEMDPSICVDIACIDFDGKKLREPRFSKFRFDLQPEFVNWKTMIRQLNPIPEKVQVTHPDKPIWPKLNIDKDDYLYYLQHVSPYYLPFLKNRYLTAIRYPHGIPGESFYQKNAPDYKPSFIATKMEEDINYILCNNIETLLWLGNQVVIEFHIPFQTVDTHYPTEIVFDLDPPSVNEFSLAIEAAVMMKSIFDQFGLVSFVKTSGGKGLQVYIPLPKNAFTYEDTRIFTEFVCTFLCEQEPNWFTMERLKKNRGQKLYLDFIQHAYGKTIIAPYSPRGNEQGLIATPLNWEEINENLTPALFSLPQVIERLRINGDPFREFREVGEKQNFSKVLQNLKQLVEERKGK